MEETTQGTNRKKRGCGLGCLVALLVGCLGIFALAAAGFLFVGAVSGGPFGAWLAAGSEDSADGGEDERPQLREVWSMGGSGTEVKVARIPLVGPIMAGESRWSGDGEGSASSALRAIQCATQDPAVRAILLEIDSPGGGITISDQIHHALCAFKASDEGRGIVALMGDVCASGGYYVALAADRIVAHPTTLTGSIGVLVSSLNIRELAEKIGIQPVTIKSGANKDMLNPFRDLTPEQTAMLQEVVNALYERFVGLVVENRGLSRETVRQWADGRVFLAEQARAAGFIDAIGYRDQAMEAVAELLGVDEPPRYIRYREAITWMELFRRPRWLGQGVVRDLLSRREARLLYQWSL